MKTAALALLLAAGACTDTTKPITGTQSLAIHVSAPSDQGSRATRLKDSDRSLTIDVTALDVNGQTDTTFNNDVHVYVQFLGTLSPYLGGTPLATIHMVNGVATGQAITLPPVFGPTTLWLDDSTDDDATYATGTSPTLWFRDPFIVDIQKPKDETSLDALQESPLDTKQVSVSGSRYGDDGRLVVTSVFAQGYTVSDVMCAAGGKPPCVAGDYDSVEVFSFSAPRDDDGNLVLEGQVISGFAGGISEFNGLTEVGFPQTFVPKTVDIDKAREPVPAKIDATWFTNKILFERVESSAIEIDNALVCPLDDDYTTFKQWKIALDGNCASKNVINLITSGVIQLDPTVCVGKTLTSVTGILRPVNIGSFNVWIVFPRSPMDLQLPSGDAQCKL